MPTDQPQRTSTGLSIDYDLGELAAHGPARGATFSDPGDVLGAPADDGVLRPDAIFAADVPLGLAADRTAVERQRGAMIAEAGEIEIVTPFNAGAVFDRFPRIGIVALVHAALSRRPAAALDEEIRQLEVDAVQIAERPGTRKLAVLRNGPVEELVELIAVDCGPEATAAENGMGS